MVYFCGKPDLSISGKCVRKHTWLVGGSEYLIIIVNDDY
jgi:hypothetical protein